ncbi:MAG: type II secretion system F family protein [Planctomycetota bacterium]
MLTYRYSVQTLGGQTLDGVIRAEDADTAKQALEQSNLRVLELERETKPSGSPLRGTDFFAFNQQLAQLTKSGLPVESGLRLIAQDMRRGRLAASINAVAEELDRGVSLPDAFEKHRRQFPPLYGQLVEAGIGSNRLPAVLMNLGTHLEMLQRLRNSLWRAAAYPLVVLTCFAGVMIFIGHTLVPRFAEMFNDFDTDLPSLTLWLVNLAPHTWYFAIAFFGLLLFFPLLGVVLRLLGSGGVLRDQVAMRLPLVGPALQRNLMARWCDMLRVGVSAGMDLPAALELAGRAVGSTRLRWDTQALIDRLEAGKSLDSGSGGSLIPASVPAAMQLASEQADLTALVGDLSAIYEQQAELRLNAIQVYLAPMLLVSLGLIMGFVVVAMFLPLVKLMQSVM